MHHCRVHVAKQFWSVISMRQAGVVWSGLSSLMQDFLAAGNWCLHHLWAAALAQEARMQVQGPALDDWTVILPPTSKTVDHNGKSNKGVMNSQAQRKARAHSLVAFGNRVGISDLLGEAALAAGGDLLCTLRAHMQASTR